MSDAVSVEAPIEPAVRSWRPPEEVRGVAHATAAGAGAVLFVTLAATVEHLDWLALAVLIGLAAVATLLPAVGTCTASVAVDGDGVAVRRFGRLRRVAWDDVVAVDIVERRANVPDGTAYHGLDWRASRRDVAVPVLSLADGSRRELPALSCRADEAAPRFADRCAEAIDGARVEASYRAAG